MSATTPASRALAKLDRLRDFSDAERAANAPVPYGTGDTAGRLLVGYDAERHLRVLAYPALPALIALASAAVTERTAAEAWDARLPGTSGYPEVRDRWAAAMQSRRAATDALIAALADEGVDDGE